MPEYSNELSGALFRNNDKRDGKKDPDYQGSCEIEGVEYWISSWINVSKAGTKYMSLKFKAKQAAAADAKASRSTTTTSPAPGPAPAPVWNGSAWVLPAAQTPQGSPDFDDDIPF
jgi:hypothetical protein